MQYQILILPLLAGIISQVIKFFISSNRLAPGFKNLVAYSGMPSGHTAIIISLTTIIGLREGMASPLFAMSVVFAIIVIRDALGLRRYLGQHGKVLNIIVKDLKEDQMLDEEYPRLLEKIGHTPWQVVAGAAIGFAISYLGYVFL